MVPRETNGTWEEYLRVFGEVGKSPWYLNTNTHNHWELFPFNMYIVLRKTHCNIPRSTTPNPPPQLPHHEEQVAAIVTIEVKEGSCGLDATSISSFSS